VVCCYSRCYVTRGVFVRVCYATCALGHSLQTSHDQHHRSPDNLVHRDVQSKHHRVAQAEQHRDMYTDVQTQHHRSFVELVHREVRVQLTKFLGGSRDWSLMRQPCDWSVMWQPFAVTYYAQLATLCLRDDFASLLTDSLTTSDDFMSLLTKCLSCAVYDIRLATLKFLAGVLDGNSDQKLTEDEDEDDDDDDHLCGLDASSDPANDGRDKLLLLLVRRAVDDDDVDLWQLLVDMLLSAETHDECLLMVSALLMQFFRNYRRPDFQTLHVKNIW